MNKISFIALILFANFCYCTNSFSQVYGQCSYNDGVYNNTGTCPMFALNGGFTSNHIPQLNYTISADSGIKKIEIYYSFDNTDFTLLITNSDIDNVDGSKMYSYLDVQNKNAPKVYYRIKGFDNYGNDFYSYSIALITDKNISLILPSMFQKTNSQTATAINVSRQ